MKAGLSFLCALAAFLLASSQTPAAAAGWTPGQQFPPGTGGVVALDVNEAGDAIFMSNRSDGTHWRLYATFRQAGGTWSAPELVSEPGGNANFTSVVLDAQGNATAIWEHGHSSAPNIRVASRPARGGWSTPHALTQPAGMSTVPALAVDSSGAAIAAWTDGTDKTLRSSFRPAGGDWQWPATVSTSTVRELSLAMEGGRAVAVWSTFDGGGAVKAASFAGGVWTPEAPVASRPEVTSPKVAVGPSGDAVGIWSIDTSANVNEPVEAAYMTTAGRWQAPVTLSSPSASTRSPQVVADGAGNMTAVWDETTATTDAIWAATRRAGSGWEPATALSTVGFPGNEPRVGVNAAGRAAVVWTGTTNVFGAVREVGGAWGPPTELRRSLPRGTAARMGGLDGQGHAVAAWSWLAGDGSVASEWSVNDHVPPFFTQLNGPFRATAGEAVQFSTTTSDTWSPGPLPVWDFGDGGRESGFTVGYTFALPGLYTVSVTQADLAGNSAVLRQNVEIVAAPEPAPAPRPAPVVRCVVPRLIGKTLNQVRAGLRRARCRLGTVRRVRSRRIRKGRVVAQRPRAGSKLRVGSRVSVSLSRGRR